MADAHDAADAASSDLWPRFEQRMHHGVGHVYAHLDEPLALLTLADLAHQSPHCGHRIECALFGATMAAAANHLRLHRAAGWRARPGTPWRAHAGALL